MGLCNKGKDVIGLFIMETQGTNKHVLKDSVSGKTCQKIIRSMEAEKQLYFGL